jgi:hypothetical protein
VPTERELFSLTSSHLLFTSNLNIYLFISNLDIHLFATSTPTLRISTTSVKMSDSEKKDAGLAIAPRLSIVPTDPNRERRVSYVDDVFGEIVEDGPNYRNVRIL